MKKLVIIITVMFFSCEECQEEKNHLRSLNHQLEQLNDQSDQFFETLKEIPFDDVVERMQVEAELEAVWIDIMLKEAEIDAYKKDNSDCL